MNILGQGILSDWQQWMLMLLKALFGPFFLS